MDLSTGLPVMIFTKQNKKMTQDSDLMELFIGLIVDIRDGVFKADQDTTCDADDEDQTEDDEGRNDNQDDKSVVLIWRTYNKRNEPNTM